MKEPITQEALNDKLNLIIERLDRLEQVEVKTETLVKEEVVVKEEPQSTVLDMTLLFLFCVFLVITVVAANGGFDKSGTPMKWLD